ncbi:MAG: peptidoglycan editing factor PgeF [Ignavibacteria bacterium]|nr:peptidoglycan editing factor PgeF [Ignavibacteria bacterium]
MSKIFIKPKIFEKFENVVCAVSTRYSGNDDVHPFYFNLSYKVGDKSENVKLNRDRLFGALGIDGNKVTYQNQTHSVKHNYVNEPSFFKDSDALFTDIPENYLAVSVADCVPVFLFEPEKKIISAVHSGWRGTHAKILTETMLTFKKMFNINYEDVIAYIGPCISLKNYEVSKEVYDMFRSEVKEIRNDKYYVDLRNDNYLQLKELGVKPENIEVTEFCTYENPELFHSYRRDKDKSGRMLGIIGLKEN